MLSSTCWLTTPSLGSVAETAERKPQTLVPKQTLSVHHLASFRPERNALSLLGVHKPCDMKHDDAERVWASGAGRRCWFLLMVTKGTWTELYFYTFSRARQPTKSGCARESTRDVLKTMLQRTTTEACCERTWLTCVALPREATLSSYRMQDL